MHRTPRSARPAAALALALAATLVVPGAAFAGTTVPTPVTTTGTSTTGTNTTTSPTTGTGTTTSTESSTSSSSSSSTSSATRPTTTAPTTTAPTTAATTAKRSASSAKSAAAPAAAAAAAVPESDAAAAFIASTLKAGGDHYVYPDFDFFDGGNTIDAILALDAVGTQSAQADASFAYLDTPVNISSYIGAPSAQYAGPTAKALLAAVAHGADPHDVGGIDLVAGLHDAEGVVEPGRFSDLPVDCGFSPCDYSNTIGQSLALIALARAGEPLSTDSVSFLLDQQCADGGFRGALEGAGCTSDPDATAFATQALVASGPALLCGTGANTLPAEVAVALDRGLDRLEALQTPSGALTSSDGTPNANTTGVAAQAFYAGGRTAPATSATAFLVTLQVGPTAPAASRGGIAFTTADRTVLETAPTPLTQTAFDSAVDRELRATPQATLALAGVSLVDVAAPGVVDASAATTCPAPPVTTTTTSTTTSTTTTSSTPQTGAADPADPGSATPGSLALTGTNVAAMTLLGALLLLAGAGAIVLARRKGVHA